MNPTGNRASSEHLGWTFAAGLLAIAAATQVLVFSVASDALPSLSEWRWLEAARPASSPPARAGLDWPLYPSLLRAVLALGLEPRAAGLALNAILAGAAALLGFALVRCWYGPRAGLLAAAVLLTFEAVLIGQRTISPDSALLVSLLGFAWALARARRDLCFRWVLLAGVFGGLGLLTDPRFLLAAIAPALGSRLSADDQRRLALRRLLLVCLIAAAIALPWYITHWRGGLLLLEAGQSVGLWQAELSLRAWQHIPSALGVVLTAMALPAVLWAAWRVERHREPVVWIAAAGVFGLILAPHSETSHWLSSLPAVAGLIAAGLLSIPSLSLRRVAVAATSILMVAQQAALSWSPSFAESSFFASIPEARQHDRWHIRPLADLTASGAPRRITMVAVPGYPVADLERLSRWQVGRTTFRRLPDYRPIAAPLHQDLPALEWLEADYLVLSDQHPRRRRGKDYYCAALNGSLRTYARPVLDAFELALDRSTPAGRIELWRRRRASTTYEISRFLEACVVIDPDARAAWIALAAVYEDRDAPALSKAAERAVAALDELAAGRQARALQIWGELVARHPGSIFTRISGEDLDRLRRL